MLHVAQEAIRRRQRVRLGVREQAVLRQLRQRRERLRVLEERRPPRVQELQRLRDEFDLPDAAAPQLHVAVQFAGLHHLRLDARFDRRDLPQRAGAERTRIAEGVHHLQELRRQLRRAGHAPRFDQHHALPRLAPLRVVNLAARQRAHQRPGVAFRSQPQVHPVQKAQRRHARHLADKRLHELREKLVVRHHGRHLRRLAGSGVEDAAFLAVEKDQIHIRAIVQLLPAQLAHAENTEFRRLPALVGVLVPGRAIPRYKLLPAQLIHRRERDLRHIGKLADDLVHRGQARQIARRQPEQLAMPELPHFVERRRIILRLAHRLKLLLQLAPQTLGTPWVRQLLRRQHREPLRVRHEQFPQRLRGAQHPRQHAGKLRHRSGQYRRGGGGFQATKEVLGARRISTGLYCGIQGNVHGKGAVRMTY